MEADSENAILFIESGEKRIHENRCIPSKCESRENVYKCEDCREQFRDKALLEIHKRTHSGPFACQECGKIYSAKGHPNARERILDKEVFSCPECEKRLCTSDESTPHKETQHAEEEPFSCQKSGKKLQTNDESVTHTETQAQQKPFSCYKCGKSFDDDFHLTEHTRTHTRERRCVCHVCWKKFRHQGTLDIHMKTHQIEDPFTCSDCGKHFAQESNLDAHKRTHAGVQALSQDFDQKDDLTSGKPLLHQEHKRKCAVKAPHVVHNKSLRGVEQNKTPTVEDLFTCQYCGEYFEYKHSLIVHMRTHTGERPYVCHVCGISFCQIGELNRHTRIHASNNPFLRRVGLKKRLGANTPVAVKMGAPTGEKLIACQRSGKSFCPRELAKPVRVISRKLSFMCLSCGMEFSTRNDFDIHCRIHAIKNEVICKVCGKEFASELLLKDHMKSHESGNLLSHEGYEDLSFAMIAQSSSRGQDIPSNTESIKESISKIEINYAIKVEDTEELHSLANYEEAVDIKEEPLKMEML